MGGYDDGALEVRQDNTAAVVSGVSSAVSAALEEMGLLGEGWAKRLCPVDTGRLRNSVTHAVDAGERAVYIGTNVEYGPYVELGTRHAAAQPFLRPAAEGHAAEYRAVLRRHMGG